MNPLDLVSFDTSLFHYRGDPGPRHWVSPVGDGVGLYHFALPPDIPASLDDLSALRRYYRARCDASQLGLIEVERVDLSGVRAIHTIIKAAQEPTGRTYVGSITLPFRDFSYVLKVQAPEHPPTGMRDTMVFAELSQTGVVQLEDGVARGWLVDPYAPELMGPMTRNRSELREYDASFPDHPLSRVRFALQHIGLTLRVADTLRTAAPFVFPAAQS
jgi:hypothetical protein